MISQFKIGQIGLLRDRKKTAVTIISHLKMLFRTFLLVTIVSFAGCWRPFRVHMYNPEYNVYFPSIADFNLTSENDVITLYFHVHRHLHEPFFHMEYVFDSGNGNYDMILANKTYDACLFLKNRKMDVLLQIFLKVAEKFGEMPQRCPFEKKLYFFRNMKIDSNYLPPVLPEKRGYAVFSLATKKENKLVTLITGKLFFKVEALYKSEPH